MALVQSGFLLFELAHFALQLGCRLGMLFFLLLKSPLQLSLDLLHHSLVLHLGFLFGIVLELLKTFNIHVEFGGIFFEVPPSLVSLLLQESELTFPKSFVLVILIVKLIELFVKLTVASPLFFEIGLQRLLKTDFVFTQLHFISLKLSNFLLKILLEHLILLLQSRMLHPLLIVKFLVI